MPAGRRQDRVLVLARGGCPTSSCGVSADSDRRRQLIARLREAQLELRPPRRWQHSIDQLRELRSHFNALLAQYAASVPRVGLSRCPVCERVLKLAIDLSGIDAPWWWDACPVEFPEPEACDHFRVFLGALDLAGRQPVEADVWAVLPGPGAPFVVERLLEMEGMFAVVSELRVGEARDVAYVIAYFSSEPVVESDLHQEWRKQTWLLHNARGAPVAHELVNDPWCFELGPWLEREKLLWIAPGDDELSLNRGRPSPFERATGTRRKQIIGSGRLKLGAPPDGSEPEYYLPH